MKPENPYFAILILLSAPDTTGALYITMKVEKFSKKMFKRKLNRDDKMEGRKAALDQPERHRWLFFDAFWIGISQRSQNEGGSVL